MAFVVFFVVSSSMIFSQHEDHDLGGNSARPDLGVSISDADLDGLPWLEDNRVLILENAVCDSQLCFKEAYGALDLLPRNAECGSGSESVVGFLGETSLKCIEEPLLDLSWPIVVTSMNSIEEYLAVVSSKKED